MSLPNKDELERNLNKHIGFPSDLLDADGKIGRDNAINKIKAQLKPIYLSELYYSINSDSSIKRYTLGWKDVITGIEKSRIKLTPPSNVYFNNELLQRAASVASPKLKDIIETFAKELNYNIQTLREK